MRLWSLHPSLLDSKALVAGWREALLAQAVLAGKTRGYTRHPQLERFRAGRDPLRLIGAYLNALRDEAQRRAYHFDGKRILDPQGTRAKLRLQRGQLAFEFAHLLKKSRQRSPEWAKSLKARRMIAHPLFKAVPGPVEAWERDPQAHA